MFSCPYCASDFTEAEMEERYHTQNETAQKEADADAKTLKDENDEAAYEEHTVFMNAHPAGHRLLQMKPPLQHSATTATIQLYLPDGSRAIISRHMCCHSLCSEMPQKKNFGHGAGNAGFCHLISAPNSSWKR